MQPQNESEVSGADLVALTADIVSAYVSNNPCSASDVNELIASVHSSLIKAAAPKTATGPVAIGRQHAAVPVGETITREYIICLEDGQKFRSLKRHLRTAYDMSPDQYREKWGLPFDYPMVAPQYAEARSQLARRMGLGSARRGVKKKKAAAQ